MTTVTLTALSGKSHTFTVCDLSLPWNEVPGLYAFVDENGTPKYIGEAGDLSTRLPGHEKWNDAVRLGAKFIVAYVHAGVPLQRKADEADLIHAYSPPLNKQHSRSGARLLSGQIGNGLLRHRGIK